MNCRTAMERSFARRDALLAPDEQSALQDHLAGCIGCREEETKREQMWRYLEGVPVREPSSNFDWRLKLSLSRLERDAVAVSPRSSRLWRSRFSLEFAASAALAACLVVGLGVLWLRPGTPPGLPTTGSGSGGVQRPGIVLPGVGASRAQFTPVSGQRYGEPGSNRPRAAGRSFFVEESQSETPVAGDSLASDRVRIGR